MTRFQWNKLLRQVEKNEEDEGLREIRHAIELQLLWSSVKRNTVLLGFALTFLTLQFRDVWVRNSPLFVSVGAFVCLVSLISCYLAGALFWLITGSKAVCVWAQAMLPFAFEPYRSASGIAGFFIILAFFWNYMANKQSLGHVPLFLLHNFLRFSCICIWLLAVFMLIVRLTVTKMPFG